MCKMTSVMKDIEDITVHVIFPGCVYISQYHVLNEWSCYFPKLHNRSRFTAAAATEKKKSSIHKWNQKQSWNERFI